MSTAALLRLVLIQLPIDSVQGASMAKFDWEEAAKRDYVARHGSVSYLSGLDSGKDPLEERDVALRARLQAALSILDDYSRLAPKEQQRHYERVYRSLCERLDAERQRLRNDEPRLFKAIDEYETGLLSILKGLRPRPTEAGLLTREEATKRGAEKSDAQAAEADSREH